MNLFCGTLILKNISDEQGSHDHIFKTQFNFGKRKPDLNHLNFHSSSHSFLVARDVLQRTETYGKTTLSP